MAFEPGTYQFDVMLGQDTVFVQRIGQVEAGLSSHGRQECLWFLALDDLGNNFRRERFDIGAVG